MHGIGWCGEEKPAAAPVLADELDHAMRSVADAQDRLSSTYHRLSALVTGPNPLPAQTPTEDQIVAALKADPPMAGRVMAVIGASMSANWRSMAGAAASEYVQNNAPSCLGLQYLAVALAAASYRG